MEISTLLKHSSKNVCRTCLLEFDTEMFTNIQDLVKHEEHKVKLIDILVFLNCLENNDEDNWPQGICSSCVSSAFTAYNFKLNCLKANATLSNIFSVHSFNNLRRSDIGAIDINVVYQDHEYDVPMFYNPTLVSSDHNDANKELTPLPPVTEITAKEQPPRTVGEKKFTCTICSCSFTRIFALRYHMNKHIGYCKYLCPKCGKRFFTSGGLNQHLKSHKDLALFKCGFCNKTYKSRQSLKEHFRVAHSSNRSLFVCVTCGKKFTAKSTLMKHMKIHDGVKDFACPNCPKTYTRAAYLRAHITVHTGQEKPKPFSCDYSNCNRRFNTKHSLVVHIAHTHSNERPHKCDICNKGFATSTGMKVHRESHFSKELSCDVCSKQFGSKRNLQKHIKLCHVENNDMNVETVVGSSLISLSI
ncbi:hypothetical protein ACJJTC_005941 [Scirpophaga incertulas]